MPYPAPTAQQIQRFQEDGFLVVTAVIDAEESRALAQLGEEMVRSPPAGANDWDWRRGESIDKRAYRIVQSGVDHLFPWLRESRFRTWAAQFGAALMQQEMEFWYEQFLGKPPGTGAPTPWHQDEGYWGRSLRNRGVTCWTAFHSVGPENGCMHFVRGGHRQILEHSNPPEMASDLLVCRIPEGSEVIACPIDAGSVTFHHSATPHMTTQNASGRWRQSLAQHFRNPICKDLPEDNYPWRVRVSQRTGERVQSNGAKERI